MTTATLEKTESLSQTSATDTFQLVSFRLGREEYGIEITNVHNIILIGSITRLPQTPPHIMGLNNLRSTVIPVIELRRKFCMPAREADENTRIVVVTVEDRRVVIVVDAVSEVMRVARNLLKRQPHDTRPRAA